MLLIIESESVCINLEREDLIPHDGVILLVSTDLQARVRAESAATKLGWGFEARRSDDDGPLADEHRIVLLDLDHIADLGAWLAAAGPLPGRGLGFFSHVQEDTGAAAEAAGIEVYPRGRFWRELPALLGIDG